MKKIVISLVITALVIFTYLSVKSYLDNSTPFNDVSGTSKDPSVTYSNKMVQTTDGSLNILFEYGPKDPDQQIGEDGNYTRSYYSLFLTFIDSVTNTPITSDIKFDVIFEIWGEEYDKLSNSYAKKPFLTKTGTAGLNYDFPLEEGTYPASFEIIIYPESIPNSDSLVTKTSAKVDDMELTIRR